MGHILKKLCKSAAFFALFCLTGPLSREILRRRIQYAGPCVPMPGSHPPNKRACFRSPRAKGHMRRRAAVQLGLIRPFFYDVKMPPGTRIRPPFSRIRPLPDAKCTLHKPGLSSENGGVGVSGKGCVFLKYTTGIPRVTGSYPCPPHSLPGEYNKKVVGKITAFFFQGRDR